MVDVTIRGAGIFGLSIAWECLARGATVRVVDPNGPGAGASGGVVGALAPHVPENWNDKKAFQLQSLLTAQDFWARVETAGGASPGYARLGRLQPVLDDHALTLAHAREETARTLWQGRAEWRVVAADTSADWAPFTPTGWLIHDTLTARIHPRQAVRALVAAVRARGGDVTAKARDEGAVIWAAGTWDLDRISTALGRMVGNGVKGQAALFALDARDRPQVFADGVHIVPHADGTVAVGSTSERDYDRPESTDERLDAVIAKAISAMPVLSGVRIIEAWAGLRPRARSRAPIMGRHPLAPDQFIANGGFKIGFGMAPGVARAMADLVLDGQDSIPEGFRPEASL